MAGSWGTFGVRKTARKAVTQDGSSDRKLVVSHRWFAGGIATVLSAALIFSGVTPAAMADEVTPPPATTVEETAPPADAPAQPVEDVVTPVEEVAPAEEAPVEEAIEEPVADDSAAQSRVAAPETRIAPAEGAAGDDVMALAGCAAPFYGFEIDGNLAPGDCAGADWDTVSESIGAVHGPYKSTSDLTDPATWYASGSPSQHAEILTGRAYATTAPSGDALLFAAWNRPSGTGSSGFIIEITKAASRTGHAQGTLDVPQPDRSMGGTVFYMDQDGNSGTVLEGVCTYSSLTTYSDTCVTNNFPANSFSGVTNDNGTFIEVGINLRLLAGVQPGCPPNLGSAVYIRSFTGNSNDLSGNIQAWVEPLSITPPSTCGSLVIEKKNVAGANLAGATFTVSPNPATGAGSASLLTDANGRITLTGTVKPGAYTVTETVPPLGYLLASPVTQNVTLAALESKTLTFVDPLGSVSWLKHDRAAALLGGATFQITATGGAAAAAPWNLNTETITVVDNTGQPDYTGRDTDATPGEFTVANLPTGTYSVHETVAPANYVLDATPKTFTIDQATQSPVISLAFVNTPLTTVTLTKAWIDAFDGDSTTLSVGGQSAVDTAPASTATVSVQVAPGTSLTIAEAFGSNKGLYSSAIACIGATPSTTTGITADITVPAWSAASASGIQCEFTNTAIRREIRVIKHWVDAFQGDTAALQVGGGTPVTSTATGAADQVDEGHPASALVRVGDTVTVSEILGASNIGTYGSVYACTQGAGTGDGRTFPLTVPNANVLCTFTNTSQQALVTLKKTWVGAFAGDKAWLSIAGGATASATSTATEGNSTDAVNVASANVRLGDMVTLSETVPPVGLPNKGTYTATWSCDNGTSGAGGSIPTIKVTGPVTCTVTNTAKTIEITVNKRWNAAFQNDSASLSIDTPLAAPVAATSVAQGIVTELDSDVVTTTVRVGDSVTIAEALGAGNQGSYATTYECETIADGTGLSFGFTAPGTDVECTFVNTALTVNVQLEKQWVNAIANDKTGLTLSGTGIVAQLRDSIASGVAGPFSDLQNRITIPVRIGAIISFAEQLAENNVGTYNSSYFCSGGFVATGQTKTISNVLVGDDDISCTFVNAAATRQVTLVKEWVNGQAGDAAALTISSVDGSPTDTSTSDGAVGSSVDDENTVTLQTTIGQPVTVSEVLTVVAGTGTAADYESSISCTSDAEGVASADDRSLTFDMPDADVTCIVTNEAELPTIELVKDVAGAEVSDTNWQLFGTPADDGEEITNEDGGDVPATEIPSDVDVALSETLIGQIAGLGEFDAGEWTCVSDTADGEVELEGSLPGAATLPGLDKGENVVCTIVNTHIPQGYQVSKDLFSSTQNPNGTWTVKYQIAVHNNSELVPIEYDLDDTVTPVAGVTFTEITWTGATSGSFALPVLTATLASDRELAAFGDEGDDDVYTVEVDLTVTAKPAQLGPCVTGQGGIGIVNTAEVTSAGVIEDDDACGTVHYDDVSLEKTAGLPDDQDSVEPGDTFDYVLTVTNNGTQPAYDVRVEDDDINDRLEIVALTVDLNPLRWETAPGYVGNDVDLTIGELAVGESATITIEVEFLAPEPLLVDHDGDPETEPIIPPLVGDDELPAAPEPLEVLENTACVSALHDGNPDNDCDDAEVPVRDITAVVYSRCVNDAPLLGWVITKSGLLIDEEINFTWTPDNATATTEPASVELTEPGGTSTWANEIAWPGAAFSPSGISIDYPGWRALVAADYAPGGGYYLPGTDIVMTAAQQTEFIFNGLIFDDSELDYAWREATTITFSVNPELVFHTEYPPATPDCFVARHTEVQLDKTASVERLTAGDAFTYTLLAQNVSDDSAAEGVVITDPIPADIKITDVSWVGEGDADTFPNWTDCAVTGQAAGGYGGTLTCTLFGPLQPVGSGLGASAAPAITLAAVLNPSATTTNVANIAVVDYHTFGDPEDAGRDVDDAVVTLGALAMTGSTVADGLIWAALLALFAGVVLLHMARRRRSEFSPRS